MYSSKKAIRPSSQLPGNTMSSKTDETSLTHLIIAISAITLLKPFYYWGAQHLLVGAIGFLSGIVCVFILLIRQMTIKIEQTIPPLFFLLLSAWQLLPIRSNPDIGPGFVYTFLVLFFLLLKVKHKKSFLLQTQRIFACIGLLSFIIVILLAVGIELPYYRMEQSFRANPNLFYYIYPGTIILSNQGFVMPSGGALFRSSGIFAEPGHFGVVCGLLLAANGFSFGTTRSKMILLGGIATFSGSFFTMLAAGFIIKLLPKKLAISKSAILSTIGVLFFFVLVSSLFLSAPQEFQDRTFWNKLSSIHSIDDLYESRADEEFNKFFYQYETSAQSLVGVGAQPDVNASDWRAEVASYGWLVFIFYFLFYFSIFFPSRASKETKVQILVAVLIVALHRVAYVDTFLVIAIVASALGVETAGGPIEAVKHKITRKQQQVPNLLCQRPVRIPGV